MFILALFLFLIGCIDAKEWRPNEDAMLDCSWLSQRFQEEGDTLNCGPASLVMASACIQDSGGALEAQDLLELMDWMVYNVGSYEPSPEGSLTSLSELVEASEGFYSLHAESIVGDLEQVFEDLMEGKPTIVDTFYQDGEGEEMTSDGELHFMLVVGMTANTIFFHDPEFWAEEEGAFRSFNLDSFVEEGWDRNGVIRFPS